MRNTNNRLIERVYRPLLREGVETLHELVGEEEIEHDRNIIKRIGLVSHAFSEEFIGLASNFNKDEDIGRRFGR